MTQQLEDTQKQAIETLSEQKVKAQHKKDADIWNQLVLVGMQMKQVISKMTANQMQRSLKAFEGRIRGETVKFQKNEEAQLAMALEQIVGLRLLLLTSNEQALKAAELQLKKARIQGKDNRDNAEKALSALEQAKLEFTQSSEEVKEGEIK